jgi:hypothetical protein
MIAAAQRIGSAAAAGLARLHDHYQTTSGNILLIERRSRCSLEVLLNALAEHKIQFLEPYFPLSRGLGCG